MKMVNNARVVFGELPPIPSGLDLELKEYDQQGVERWLQEEHGVMFLDPGEVEEEGGIDAEEEVREEEEDGNGDVELGEVPDISWDENLIEPESTAYDLENAPNGSEHHYIEDPHR